MTCFPFVRLRRDALLLSARLQRAYEKTVNSGFAEVRDEKSRHQ